MSIVFVMFLWTVPIGAVLFAIAWLPTRGLTARSRIWRLVLSSIVGLAVTPTTLQICGRDYICPASFASLMVLAPDSLRRSCLLLVNQVPERGAWQERHESGVGSNWAPKAERVRRG